MKRIISVLFVVLMMAALVTSCSDSSSAADLKAVMDDVNSQFSISGLTVLEDASKLTRYFNIAEEDVKQFAAEFSTDASEFNEIILVEGVDADAAGRIATLLNNHLDSKISEGKSYSPEAVSMLESCSVKQNGNVVYLVISDQQADIVSLIESKL